MPALDDHAPSYAHKPPQVLLHIWNKSLSEPRRGPGVPEDLRARETRAGPVGMGIRLTTSGGDRGGKYTPRPSPLSVMTTSSLVMTTVSGTVFAE